MSDALFDATPYEVAPEPDTGELSADRRRTLRQQTNVNNGIHPLTNGPLHEQASSDRTPASPGTDPFTCGTCIHRRVTSYHDRKYPKCDLGPVSSGAGTDVRAWWPACNRYETNLPHLPEGAPS